MKKTLILLALAIGLTACGTSAAPDARPADSGAPAQEAPAQEAPAASTGAETLDVSFWSAPNQQQFDFWSAKADAFNATGTQVNGKTVRIAVQQMPETPSSEAGIQSAIATGTVPAASENINVSFVSVLAGSQVLYPLENEAWFTALCQSRSISDEMMAGWAIGGSQYVIPLYINPLTMQWNKKALDALGMDVPKTLDEFNAVIEAFMAERDGKMAEIGVTHTFYRPQLLRSDQWWERNFEFEMQRRSFSDGKNLVEGDKLVMDEAGAKKTFEFYGSLGDTMLLSEITPFWTQDTVPALFGIAEPWEINNNDVAGKVYGVDYVYGPTIVENAGDTAYSFADTKGLTFYKHSSISEDQHQGAVEFIKWAYSPENAQQTDLDWWLATNMMPVRGDLSTNPAYSGVTEQSPAMAAISEYIPYAAPMMSHPQVAEILTALSEGGLVPYIMEASALPPFNAPDATSYVQQAMTDMKAAGNLK